MHPIPQRAAAQFGVFTVDQALATGWSRSALSRATRAGHLVQLRRGAFALASTAESGHALTRLRLGQHGVAAALRIPIATVSHGAAIAIHGLPLLSTPAIPCVTLPPPYLTRPAELHVHRQPISPWQLDARHDISITSVARSCLDFTRECGLDAGLVATDAALHNRLCSLADLEAVYSASCKGRAGLSSGRTLLDLADGRSESPLESISRLAMIAATPAPQTQVNLHSPNGQFLARVDFYWKALGVVGEADGKGKYAQDELWKEKLRQDRLADHGLVMVRWGWSEARRPALLQAKLQQAFLRASQLRSAGIPITAHLL